MKIGKILIAGFAVTIFNVIVGMVTCGGIFSWVYKLQPTNVWRSTDGGPGISFIVRSFVLNVILSLVYVLIQKGLPVEGKLKKGMVFGVCVWAVGLLPGMLATQTFMTVASTVVVYWTLLGLVQKPLEGMIIAAIYGD